MKLYNLYESVILEEISKGKNLLLEGVSDATIDDAIDQQYNVRIKYEEDKGAPPSDRYIQIYNRGVTKTKNGSGNPAIRAYQIGGHTKTSVGVWKIFLINKILSMEKTNMKWYNPVSDRDQSIPAYNQTGDNSFSVVNRKVDPLKFTRDRSDITQKPSPKLQITNNDNENI